MLAREIRWVMETLLQEYGRDHELVKELLDELEHRFKEIHDLDWSQYHEGAITVNPAPCPWCGNQGTYNHEIQDYMCTDDDCEAITYRYGKVLNHRPINMGAAWVPK